MTAPKQTYTTQFSVARNGWCVFRIIDGVSMTYHAGPFYERSGAESEARRLNELNAEDLQK